MNPRLLLRVLVFLAIAFALLPGEAGAQGLIRETLREYDVVNGYFYTQTGGDSGDRGYSITDEDNVPLWREYQRLGGPDALGYPISRRFVWDGFVVQATQKAVLQWRPEAGRAVTVNLLDELSRTGKDDWLATYRQIPRPVAFTDEAGLSPQQVADKRLRLLDESPALRTAYLASPDFLETNGLPVAPITDVGPALVLRAQRRAFQLWKVGTPFARAGQVTVVNGGDLGKEAELYPAAGGGPGAGRGPDRRAAGEQRPDSVLRGRRLAPGDRPRPPGGGQADGRRPGRRLRNPVQLQRADPDQQPRPLGPDSRAHRGHPQRRAPVPGAPARRGRVYGRRPGQDRGPQPAFRAPGERRRTDYRGAGVGDRERPHLPRQPQRQAGLGALPGRADPDLPGLPPV